MDEPARRISSAAGAHAEARAFGFNEGAREFSESAQRRFLGGSSEAAGESRRPAAKMLAQELLLGRLSLRGLLGIQLMFVGVRFLGGEHTHEFVLQTKMIVTLAGVIGDFESERTIEGSEVSEAVRLEERVGLEVAIFDLVQWTVAARGVAEDGKAGILERFESGPLQRLLQDFTG